MTNILTPVGRIVSGGPGYKNTKNMAGQPLTDRNGNPRFEVFIGLAIPKTDPGVDALIQQIKNEGRQSMPQQANSPNFAWKIIDGDSDIPNASGRAPRDKEGYAGHWVFKFSSGFESKCYTAGGAERIADPETIKTGDYIRIAGSVKGNNSATNPGVFLNHHMIEFIGHGEPISSGPDAASVFGSAPAANVPPAASPTPVAPATPAVPAPPSSNPEVYEVNGAEYTRDQLKASGWSDAQIDALDPVPF